MPSSPQDGFTVIAPVIPGRRAALEQCLDQLDAEVRAAMDRQVAPAHDDIGLLKAADPAATASQWLPFGRLPNVHFARLVIVDFSIDVGACSEPRLVLCTDFDGSVATHIDDLAEVLGDGLDWAFSHCQGYSAMPGSTTGERVRAFVKAHGAPNNI